MRLAGTVVTVPAGSTVLGPADGVRPPDRRRGAPPARSRRRSRAFVRGRLDPGRPPVPPLPGRRAVRRGLRPDAGHRGRRPPVAGRRPASPSGPTSADGLAHPGVGDRPPRWRRPSTSRWCEARLASGRTGPARHPGPAGARRRWPPRSTGVVGLGDQATATPQIVRRRAAWPPAPGGSPSLAPGRGPGPRPCSPPSAALGVGAGRPPSWRRTYGLSTLYADGRIGAGQTVGIFELEPFTPSDIAAYQACYGTSVPVTTVPVDGGRHRRARRARRRSTSRWWPAWPRARRSASTRAPTTTAPDPIDTYAAMVDQDAAKVLVDQLGRVRGDDGPGRAGGRAPRCSPRPPPRASRSWPRRATPGRATADSASTPTATQLAVDDPADQPDVTGVGGTSLTSATPDAPDRDGLEQLPSGRRPRRRGGNSTGFVAPAWQQVAAAQSADTTYTCGTPADQQCREVPDVVGLGRPGPRRHRLLGGHLVDRSGGRARPSPLWAALVADTDQGCASPGRPARTRPSTAPAPPPSFNDVTVGHQCPVRRHRSSRRGPATTWPPGGGARGPPHSSACCRARPAGCPTVTGAQPVLGPGRRRHHGDHHRDAASAPAPRSVHFGGVPPTVTGVDPDLGDRGHAPTSTSAGPSAVTVTTTGTGGRHQPGGGRRPEFTFTSPQVTSVAPAKGPTAGGGRVTVEGTGFTGATACRSARSPATFQVTVADHASPPWCRPGRRAVAQCRSTSVTAARAPARRRPERPTTTPGPATCWPPPTAACSPTARPGSSAPAAGRPWSGPGGRHGHGPRRQGLLDGGRRRRGPRLRQCRVASARPTGVGL